MANSTILFNKIIPVRPGTVKTSKNIMRQPAYLLFCITKKMCYKEYCIQMGCQQPVILNS